MDKELQDKKDSLDIDIEEGYFVKKPIATSEELEFILPHLIPKTVIKTTEQFLREAGDRNCEGVVLWVGERPTSCFRITRCIVPLHSSGRNYFDVSLKERIRIVTSLAANECIIAQVHSHPEEAFHSPVDDRKAVIDRRWALSIVVPDFCDRDLGDMRGTAVFALRDSLDWIQLSEEQIKQVLIIG